MYVGSHCEVEFSPHGGPGGGGGRLGRVETEGGEVVLSSSSRVGRGPHEGRHEEEGGVEGRGGRGRGR